MNWLFFKRSVLILGLPAFVACIASTSASEEKAFEPFFKQEKENENIPVVGAYVAGAAYVSKTLSPQRPSLLARIPKEWAGQVVCARGSSIDGVYEGLFGYKIPTSWTGKESARLDYQTKYAERVQSANSDNFGVVLALGDCDSSVKTITPVFWNSVETENINAVQLMVNSVSANEVYIFVGEDADAPAIICNKLDAEIAKEFDHLCIVPLGLLSKARTRIEINTKFSGVGDPPVNIFIETGVAD